MKPFNIPNCCLRNLMHQHAREPVCSPSRLYFTAGPPDPKNTIATRNNHFNNCRTDVFHGELQLISEIRWITCQPKIDSACPFFPLFTFSLIYVFPSGCEDNLHTCSQQKSNELWQHSVCINDTQYDVQLK